MKAPVSRAILLLAAQCLGERRREWSMAMQAELETAVSEGQSLRFATGCLIAAWREMLRGEEGRLVITSYAMVFGLLMPMAALQIGCALFGLPYLYPGQHGLPGALLEGSTHEHLLRGVYQAAIPALALLQVLIGFGHVRIAWGILDQDWEGVTRSGARTLAAAATLIVFMSVLFLNGRQALLQGTILGIELMSVAVVARWHTQLLSEARPGQPG